MTGSATQRGDLTAESTWWRNPSVGGLDLTDASTLAGAVVWVVVTVAGDLGAIDRALALAPLVLVPLGMGLAATPRFDGLSGRFYDLAVVLQPLGALFFVGSLLVPSGVLAAGLAAPWVLVTGLLACAGLARMRERGLGPLSETVVDAGLAYAVVGAVALVLFHLGITFWFSPVIILLTAVHFHYAGFVLPIATGLTGRCGSVNADPVYRTVASVVLVGPAIIALGISFSPAVELVGVGAFTLAVTVLGVFIVVRVSPTRPRVQGVLLAASALTLPVSMGFALGFVLATVLGIDPLGLTIPRMVSLHGNLNAFGFALLAMVGWRLSVPSYRSLTTTNSARS